MATPKQTPEWPDINIDVQCWNQALDEMQKTGRPINYSHVAQRAQQLKNEQTKGQ